MWPQAKQRHRRCINFIFFIRLSPPGFFIAVKCFNVKTTPLLYELLGHVAARKVFDQHMEKSKLQDGRPCYKCSICGKESSHLNNARNHIESVHFPGHFSYNCDHCEKTFKSKNALCTHVSLMHKY